MSGRAGAIQAKGSDGTLGAEDLEEPMDQLEEIYPPGGGA